MTSRARKKVWIISRIFSPEPAAASARLAALTTALHDAGFVVEVLTVTEPSGKPADTPPGVRVHRAPVLRDASGYVRGVLQYLSFDIPLAFRMLLRRRPAAIIVEPPPTSGAVVRVMAQLLGVKYMYYAADIWADALQGTAVSPLMQSVMAWIERFAMRGAALVLTVSPETTQRVAAITGEADRIQMVPHGVDTELFNPHATPRGDGADSLYAGMASERHGADVFIEALPLVLAKRPHTIVRFMGYGSEWQQLQERAEELGISHALRFDPPVPPSEMPGYLRNSQLALASLAPGVGYDYAFPTKIYAALATGTPVLFAGVGPAGKVLQEHKLGWAVEPDIEQVAQLWLQALQECQESINLEEKMRIAAWVQQNRTADASAEAAVSAIAKVAQS